MKLILQQRSAPVALADAKDIIAGWEKEHAQYYGCQHGRTMLFHHMEHTCAGFAEVMVPVVSAFQEPIIGSRWLTCGGNDHRIAFIEPMNLVIVAYEGRRHGMRPEFRDFLGDYWPSEGPTNIEKLYLTTEPDWEPWETKL